MADKSSRKAYGYGHGANFRVAEAYRMIRTNLLFSLANAKSNVVVISSAEPSAGKSTLCSNLSIVMAQTGARVLLIDADMRRPSQHRNFHVSKSNGLSRVLGGLVSTDECIVRQVAPNLDLLTAGSIPPNPSELLGSERMRTLIEKVQKEYDYVFIDTPPLGVVADALVIMPLTAGIVLASRQRQTTYDEVIESTEAIKNANGTFLGLVITDVHIEKVGYASYSKNRYYRDYNYRYDAGKKTDD